MRKRQPFSPASVKGSPPTNGQVMVGKLLPAATRLSFCTVAIDDFAFPGESGKRFVTPLADYNPPQTIIVVQADESRQPFWGGAREAA